MGSLTQQFPLVFTPGWIIPFISPQGGPFPLDFTPGWLIPHSRFISPQGGLHFTPGWLIPPSFHPRVAHSPFILPQGACTNFYSFLIREPGFTWGEWSPVRWERPTAVGERVCVCVCIHVCINMIVYTYVCVYVCAHAYVCVLI